MAAAVAATGAAVEVRWSVHEAFERLPADRVVEVGRPGGASDALVELGPLVRIELGGGDVVPRDGPVWPVTSAGMDQL